MSDKENNIIRLNITQRPYLSSLDVWALAVGSSVGWGSLVVTANTYLTKAGPAGSILGLVLSALLMLVISRNFHYMAAHYPDAGGIYTYIKSVYGYDRAFLVFWFLGLTYMAMFWANATSIPLFARYFLGNAFRFGYLYSIFGYEVYIGEILIILLVVLLAVLLCMKSRIASARLMTGMVIVFVAGISICMAAAMAGRGAAGVSMEPCFVPDSRAFSQIIRIVLISPWAFIGFENVTHSVEEFRFGMDKLFRILCISVVTTVLLYIFVILLSVSAYPAGCGSWFEYITRLGEFSGMDGLPAFYGARAYLGRFGVILLMLSLLCLILTSLIGNLKALSRLFYSVARDDILPARFASLNARDIPDKAVLLVGLLSIVIPFFGRTAIGWIVDVTTIGAVLIYGFVSAAAYKTAKREGRKREKTTGLIGFIFMILLGICLLVPDLVSAEVLETETYILIIAWSVLGFFFFNRIISNDHARRFGKAIIVWITLLALVVLMSMIWTERVEDRAVTRSIETIQSYYNGTADTASLAMDEEAFLAEQARHIHNSNLFSKLVVGGLFVMALFAMLFNYFSMRRWEEKTARERDQAHAAAYIDPLTGVKSKHAYAEQESLLDARIEENNVMDFGLVIGDVNGLKYVNDTYGHKAGDEYIRSACMLICKCFQHSPVYRIGGDEFTVLLQGTDLEMCDTLVAAANEQIEANLAAEEVVVALGVSRYRPDEDHSFHEVFMRADRMMYERKQQLKAMGAKTRE